MNVKVTLFEYNKVNTNGRMYQKALCQRTNETNKVINQFLNQEQPGTLVVEDLKNVKHNSKLNTKFMNKLQYWTYLRILNSMRGVYSSSLPQK